jgi:hypothetical protein
MEQVIIGIIVCSLRELEHQIESKFYNFLSLYCNNYGIIDRRLKE